MPVLLICSDKYNVPRPHLHFFFLRRHYTFPFSHDGKHLLDAVGMEFVAHTLAEINLPDGESLYFSVVSTTVCMVTGPVKSALFW